MLFSWLVGSLSFKSCACFDSKIAFFFVGAVSKNNLRCWIHLFGSWCKKKQTKLGFGQEKTRTRYFETSERKFEHYTRSSKKHKKKQNKNQDHHTHTIEIWLILPVVICLFQGLSHACLRITVENRNLRMAHYIRRNLPQKLCGHPHYWITWRNAKLIHEPKGASVNSGGWFAWTRVWCTLRMDDTKIIASDEAATQSSVDSIHSVRKPTCSASFDEQLPYQPVMAV